jgi:hypothetical protein
MTSHTRWHRTLNGFLLWIFVAHLAPRRATLCGPTGNGIRRMRIYSWSRVASRSATEVTFRDGSGAALEGATSKPRQGMSITSPLEGVQVRAAGAGRDGRVVCIFADNGSRWASTFDIA